MADCEKPAQYVASLDYVQIHTTAHRATQWMGRRAAGGHADIIFGPLRKTRS